MESATAAREEIREFLTSHFPGEAGIWNQLSNGKDMFVMLLKGYKIQWHYGCKIFNLRKCSSPDCGSVEIKKPTGRNSKFRERITWKYFLGVVEKWNATQNQSNIKPNTFAI
eukprot:GHVP01068016.1.p1 GENE.GHVP01068016.1~~GHVP01068016.1.p1  ORF type:complete len:112 (+),score=13.80 GHVP01068016.1:274-609(+)